MHIKCTKKGSFQEFFKVLDVQEKCKHLNQGSATDAYITTIFFFHSEHFNPRKKASIWSAVRILLTALYYSN